MANRLFAGSSLGLSPGGHYGTPRLETEPWGAPVSRRPYAQLRLQTLILALKVSRIPLTGPERCSDLWGPHSNQSRQVQTGVS